MVTALTLLALALFGLAVYCAAELHEARGEIDRLRRENLGGEAARRMLATADAELRRLRALAREMTDPDEETPCPR